MTAPRPIQFPAQFKGLFHRVEASYQPLVADALQQLHAAPMPAALRPFFDHVRIENPQPSFFLLPLIFLAAAEASGGITPRHLAALPTMLLGMEVIAVTDDAVDRTPMRSGRPSFPGRFGDTSATPFVGALLMQIAERANGCPAEIVDATTSCLLHLFSLFLWEHQHIYPEPALFHEWLEHRYAETLVVSQYVLDGALALNGHPPVPAAAMHRFSLLFQDVDDVVNLVEHRAEQGENDDLQMGVVTRPLLLALEHTPALLADLEALWRHYRPLRRASLVEFQARHAEVAERTRPIHERLHAAILEVGVPATVRRMLEDLRRCVEETPGPLRPFMRELTRTIVDRLRRCGRPDLDRLLDESLGEGEALVVSQVDPRRACAAICVYCSSSDAVAPQYFAAATSLGAALGQRGRTLVFGGSNTGLMGAVASATHAHGGRVLGVIPEIMRGTPHVFADAHEVVSTRDLRARKAAMEARADAFVVLPGGFGTLDETLEVLAAKQMHLHHKPIVFLNTGDFWRPLMHLFDHMFRERFASQEHHQRLYHLADDADAVFAYLDGYAPPPFPIKWF